MIPAGKGKMRVVSTADAKTRLWRDGVQKAAAEAVERAGWSVPSGHGLELLMIFRLDPAGKVKGGGTPGQPATSKPDIDNLAKLIMDALQDAGAFGKGNDPDALVTAIEVRKVWAGTDGNGVEYRPGVTIMLGLDSV